MSRSLPTAEIVLKFLDESFDLHTPVWMLRWSDADAGVERLWELPEGFSIMGTAPARFGLRIRRHASDSYAVQIVWERTRLDWKSVSRLDLLGSCLSPLLGAVGLDLWSLLEQPIPRARMERWAA